MPRDPKLSVVVNDSVSPDGIMDTLRRAAQFAHKNAVYRVRITEWFANAENDYGVQTFETQFEKETT